VGQGDCGGDFTNEHEKGSKTNGIRQVINDEHEPQEGSPEPQGCLKKCAVESITDECLVAVWD